MKAPSSAASAAGNTRSRPRMWCEIRFLARWRLLYDYDRIKRSSLTRAAILSRPKSMWRYRELPLPVAGEPTVGFEVGYTPC